MFKPFNLKKPKGFSDYHKPSEEEIAAKKKAMR